MSCAKTAKFLSWKVCTQLNHWLDFSCALQGQEKRYVDPVSVCHRVLPILTVKVLVAHGYLQEHEMNLTKWTPHLETKFHILLLRKSGEEKQRVCQDIFSNTTLQLTSLQNGTVYFWSWCRDHLRRRHAGGRRRKAPSSTRLRISWYMATLRVLPYTLNQISDVWQKC